MKGSLCEATRTMTSTGRSMNLYLYDLTVHSVCLPYYCEWQNMLYLRFVSYGPIWDKQNIRNKLRIRIFYSLFATRASSMLSCESREGTFFLAASYAQFLDGKLKISAFASYPKVLYLPILQVWAPCGATEVSSGSHRGVADGRLFLQHGRLCCGERTPLTAHRQYRCL